MKNSLRLTLLLSCLMPFIVFSQDEFCRMNNMSNLLETEDCTYEDLPNGNTFRIAIHIIRNSNGQGGILQSQNITEEELIIHIESMLNESFDFPTMNTYDSPCVYPNEGFLFNTIALDYIDEDVYYQPGTSNLFNDEFGMANNLLLESLLELQTNCNTINIYLSDNYCDVSGGVANNLEFPAENLGIWIGGSTSLNQPMALSKVLAHEMGHIFGLSHVFDRTSQFILNSTGNFSSESKSY
jgi:hypothetical protein